MDNPLIKIISIDDEKIIGESKEYKQARDSLVADLRHELKDIGNQIEVLEDAREHVLKRIDELGGK